MGCQVASGKAGEKMTGYCAFCVGFVVGVGVLWVVCVIGERSEKDEAGEFVLTIEKIRAAIKQAEKNEKKTKLKSGIWVTTNQATIICKREKELLVEIDRLQTENAELADFLALAKEQMDAQAKEIEAAHRLSRIYFEIARDFLSEDEIKEIRDKKMAEMREEAQDGG